MRIVPEVSSRQEASKLVNQMRSRGFPDHDFGAALAALIYLRWADFQEAEREAMASFDGTEYRAALPDYLHWHSWSDLSADELASFFKKRLQPRLQRLRSKHQNLLATQLQRVASPLGELSQLSIEGLAFLVRWVAHQPIETPNDRRRLLDAFDNVLELTADRYFRPSMTPTPVARLMVSLASPLPGHRVYDPCFGTAALLTATYESILSHEKGGVAIHAAPVLAFSGIESNPWSYTIGLTRLVLAGVEDPQLELGNSLERTPPTNPQQDGFDIVVANPPWGTRVEQPGLDYYPVQTKDATSLFIQHALLHLRPGGRAVIVVPQGILFRSGAETRLRRMLVEQNTVESVVALPETAFVPYARVQINILVVRRGGSTDRIRMVDATPFFDRAEIGKPSPVRADLAEQLSECLRSPQASKHWWDVDAKSLADAEWDLSPKRYDRSRLRGLLDELGSEVEVVPLKECCVILSGRKVISTDLVERPTVLLEGMSHLKQLENEERLLRSELEQLELGKRDSMDRKQILLERVISLMAQQEAARTRTSVAERQANAVPYIRIKDVQRGRATGGSSWLCPKEAGSVDAESKLRAGDILLSRSGTIGKVGLVERDAVGAIASSGLFVLRPDKKRLEPQYLLAYLDSSECRDWLVERTRGATTIRHLSRQVLEELPVPLPSLQIQQRVSADYKQSGSDALILLTQVLTESERDPFSEWEDALRRFLPEDAFDERTLDLAALDRFAAEIKPIRNLAVHYGEGKTHLLLWFSKLYETISKLRGVQKIPRGPGLLSVLQGTARALPDTNAVPSAQSPILTKARNLTTLLTRSLDRARLELVNDMRLVLSANVGVLQVGQMAEISLEVHNQGPLPLRDLSIKTTPDWGEGKIGYLAENTKTAVQLAGAGPKVSGDFVLQVSWSAVNLDGQVVTGSRELAFQCFDSSTKSIRDDFQWGSSPYVCGGAVGPERKDVFFGREELLDQIRRHITQSGNVVLLEGNRRAGKSSVLSHLVGPNSVPGWMGIYCSFQGAEGSSGGSGVPTAEIFRVIATEIASGLHTLGGETPLPNGTALPPNKTIGIARACREGIGESAPFSDFREYLGSVLQKLATRNLGLLLMLDEFDKLQEGIDSGVTSPQVPENIRFVVQYYKNISAILTGSRRLKRLREEYWSVLFGLGIRLGVTAIPAEEARRLVTKPVQDRLVYSREAVDKAIWLTARQPYLLQCLCSRIFDMAVELKTRSVTLDIVEQAANVLVEDFEHFAFLWTHLKSDRRRFILSLCQKEAEGPDPLRFGVIQDKLLSHGIEVDAEVLIADLEFLRELELLDLIADSGGGYYALTVPLMGLWVKRDDFAVRKSKALSETEDQRG